LFKEPAASKIRVLNTVVKSKGNAMTQPRVLSTRLLLASLLFVAGSSAGCAVIAVADAAITVGATAVKIGAKTVGAVVDVVTPDSDAEKAEKAKK
jgi:hypothetical protein